MGLVISTVRKRDPERSDIAYCGNFEAESCPTTYTPCDVYKVYVSGNGGIRRIDLKSQ